MKTGRVQVLVWAAFVILLFAAGERNALAEAPLLQGKVDCPWGSPDCNRCVVDVVDSIERLRSHGDILGFHMNGAEDVDVSHHWQGIQRLTSGGGRYFAVSRSVSDEDAGFVVVEMGTRNGTGLRFRSNRLDPDLDNFSTPPPLEDGVALEVARDPDFKHAGGLQLLGNFLAVPVERGATIDPGPPPTVEDPGASKVLFYDLTDPLSPVLIHELDHSNLSNEAGAAFLARLSDGRILLGVGRADSAPRRAERTWGRSRLHHHLPRRRRGRSPGPEPQRRGVGSALTVIKGESEDLSGGKLSS